MPPAWPPSPMCHLVTLLAARIAPLRINPRAREGGPPEKHMVFPYCCALLQPVPTGLASPCGTLSPPLSIAADELRTVAARCLTYSLVLAVHRATGGLDCIWWATGYVGQWKHDSLPKCSHPVPLKQNIQD